MDLGTLIIGVILGTVCVLPFFIIGIMRKRGEKKQLSRLLAFAKTINKSITRYDLWTNSAIGIDDTENELMVVRLVNGEEAKHHIALRNFQSCRVETISREVANDGKKYKVVDAIRLILIAKAKSKNSIALEMYNAEYDSLTLSNELQLAEKWCDICTNAFAV